MANYISISLAMPAKKELNVKIPHFVEIQQQEKTLCKGSRLSLNKEFSKAYLSSYTYIFRYTTFLTSLTSRSAKCISLGMLVCASLMTGLL